MRALYALALPLIVWLAVVAIGTAQLDALTRDSLSSATRPSVSGHPIQPTATDLAAPTHGGIRP